MFCKFKTVFYYFKILTNFTCKRIRANVANTKFMWIKNYFLKYFKTFDASNRSYFTPNLSLH